MSHNQFVNFFEGLNPSLSKVETRRKFNLMQALKTEGRQRGESSCNTILEYLLTSRYSKCCSLVGFHVYLHELSLAFMFSSWLSCSLLGFHVYLYELFFAFMHSICVVIIIIIYILTHLVCIFSSSFVSKPLEFLPMLSKI